MRKHPVGVVARLQALGPERVAISVITAIELRQGADASREPTRYHLRIDDFLSEMRVFQLDAAAARTVGRVRSLLRRSGKPIGDLDSLIAGHALSLGLVLVTHNTREFVRVTGLSVEDWV